MQTRASWPHLRRSLSIDRPRNFEEFGTQTELCAAGRIEIHVEPNVILENDELNHAAMLKEIGGVADCQNRLTAKRDYIGCQASAFGRTDVCNGTPMRLNDAFEADDPHRLVVEVFIGGEIVERVPKQVLAYDADIKTLAIGDCI